MLVLMRIYGMSSNTLSNVGRLGRKGGVGIPDYEESISGGDSRGPTADGVPHRGPEPNELLQAAFRIPV